MTSPFEESDVDSGLDELISLILPQVDEEIKNNPELRQMLNDSPPPNAEEYPINLIPIVAKTKNAENHDKPEQKTHVSMEWLTDLSSSLLVQDNNQQPQPTTTPLMLANPLIFGNYINKSENSQNTTYNDPIKEIEDSLNEIDEDFNGYIDFSEFGEVMEVIDDTIIHGEIDAIYDFITSKYPSNTCIGELNIKIFIKYLRDKFNEYKKYNIYNSDSETVIRIAFEDIFNINDTRCSDNNYNEITTTNLWGVKKLSSLERLQKILEEENESLDFPEFESAMYNLGVMFEKENNKQVLFQHFIRAQSISITSKHLHKRKELNIAFFIKYISTKVKGYKLESMQPKQILNVAFNELLNEGIKSQKGSHKKTLNLPQDDSNDSDDNNTSVNPYLDGVLMGGLQKEFAPEQIQKFENTYIVANNGNKKEHRKLVRLESGLNWKESEFNTTEQEMRAKLAEMMNTQNGDLGFSPAMGIVREDQVIE